MRLAFIGSAGLPNRYGGFESFVETCGPILVKLGHEVTVTCDKRYYEDHSSRYAGVRRVFLALPANGALSPFHDLIAFLTVFSRVDTVIVLGISAGPFFAIMRLLASLFGKRILVNIDGVEWRRAKYSLIHRAVLRAFDLFAQLCANAIIYDNPALKPYIRKAFHRKASCIGYPGDQVARLPERLGITRAGALTICRIEPENNIEMLITGALGSSIGSYKIIGNWENSKYGRDLRSKYMAEGRLLLLDPVYEHDLIARYRESCSVYLHGHGVGGTNPSLVEMLFYDCTILCFDCDFNRHTAGDRASYFSTADELSLSIDRAVATPSHTALSSDIGRYKATYIAQRYLEVADH